MKKSNLFGFLAALAWVWMLVYASEYKAPSCFVAPVLSRIERVNGFTGKKYWRITVQHPNGQTLTVRRASSGAYYKAKDGDIQVCRNTGRFTRIKSPWYTPY